MEIYCGNNQFELGPGKRLGTPHECLKKGVGQGLHSDLTRFNPNYQAIIPDNSYCGSGVVPQGKTMGTPASCLRKGVGIGMKLQFERSGGRAPPPSRASTTSSRYYSARSTLGSDDDDIVEHFEDQPQVQPVSSSFLLKWWPVMVVLLVAVVTWYMGASWSTIASASVVALAACLVIRGRM